MEKNDKNRVFECNVGRKIMPLILEDTKKKLGFRPALNRPGAPYENTAYRLGN
jgi:hypothetical protein